MKGGSIISELSGRPLLATPADAPLFVDREAEATRIHRAIGSGTNTLVLGARGIGKTSLLRRVEVELGEPVRPIWVQGQVAEDPVDLLALIRYRIEPRERVDYAEAWRQAAGAIQFRPPPPSQRLLEMVERLEATLRERDEHFVVFVDELRAAEVAHTLFGRLRDELWQLPLTWVVAGNTADSAIYLRPPADAFFLNVVRLGPLSEHDAFRLLRARIPSSIASDRLLRKLVDEAGGQPRALLMLANETLVGGRDLDAASTARAQREKILEKLGEAAKRVVAELEANGPASASDEEFLSRVQMKRSRAAQVLSALERAGVVRGASDRSASGSRRKLYALES